MTNISANQLLSIIERIEELERQKSDITESIKEVYSEAKGNGFDAPTIKKIVAMRKKSREELSEQEMLLETYLQALGM